MDRRNYLIQQSGRFLRVADLLAFLITAAAYLPFVVAARYSVFHSDDFANCTSTFAMPVQNLFVNSLQKAWNIYTTWQGTYVYNILAPLFNPLHRYSYLQCRLILMGLLILAFLSAVWFCAELCKSLNLGENTGILCMILLLPIILFRNLADPIFWYIGSINYMVPAICLALGLAFLLQGRRKHSRFRMVLACICLFLSGGGTPMIGGLGACATLIPFVVLLIENRKVDRSFLAAFLSVFTGDLVNVLAPGNYVRAPGEFLIAQSLLAAFKMYRSSLLFHASHMIFLFVILLAFLLGLQYGKRLSPAAFSIAVIGLLLTPAVPAFPYVLGYDIVEETNLAGRMWLAVDLALTGCFGSTAFLFGGQIRGYMEDKGGRVRGLQNCVAVIAGIFLLLGISHAKVSLPVQVTENLGNGKIAAYAAEWHEIYDMLSMRPGENVLIEWQPDPCVGVMEVSIGAAPEHWKNYNLALYFGNESVVDAWYASTHPEWPGNAVS